MARAPVFWLTMTLLRAVAVREALQRIVTFWPARVARRLLLPAALLAALTLGAAPRLHAQTPPAPRPAPAGFEPADPAYHNLTGTFASSGAHFVTTAPFAFVDAAGVRWEAPACTVTDGVSIPRAWLSFIGSPTEAQFMPAAILHDAYCARDNQAGAAYHARPRRAVDRMFYEALRAGGTSRGKARLMYVCVRLFGPATWLDAAAPAVPASPTSTAHR